MFVLNLLNDPPCEKSIDLMLSHGPDALIFSAMGLRRVSIPERLKSKPLVLANCLDEDSSLVSDIPDDEAAAPLGALRLESGVSASFLHYPTEPEFGLAPAPEGHEPCITGVRDRPR